MTKQTRSAHANTWRIAGPVILSNISIPLVGIVDAAIIGHLPEHQLLAAVNLGAATISLLFFVFGFLRMGTSGLVAQAFGAGDQQALGDVFRRALIIAAVLGCLLAILHSPITLLTAHTANGTEALAPLSEYLRWRLYAAPFALIGLVTTATLIATDRAGTAVAIQIAANLLNMGLDYVFVYHLGWEVSGVAAASAIAEISACLVGLYLLRGYLTAAKQPISATHQRASWLQLFTVNRDIFIRSSLLVSVIYSLTAISGQHGTVALAASGILLNLFYLCAYALDGFANAAEVLCGQAYGARKREDFRQHVRTTSIWAIGFALLLSSVYAVFGQQLIALQTSIHAVQTLAQDHLIWFICMPMLGVAAFMMDGICIGTTHTREMRNSVALSTAIYLLALAAVGHWGLTGLWLSFSTFMVARGVILCALYRRIERGFAAT